MDIFGAGAACKGCNPVRTKAKSAVYVHEFIYAAMAKLADALDLGSSGVIHNGSSPFGGTKAPSWGLFFHIMKISAQECTGTEAKNDGM